MIFPKGVKDPKLLFIIDKETYGICGISTLEDGSTDEERRDCGKHTGRTGQDRSNSLVQ